jgi:hypothetical protein
MINYYQKKTFFKIIFYEKIPIIGYCLVLLIIIYLLSILIVAWRPEPTLKTVRNQKAK